MSHKDLLKKIKDEGRILNETIESMSIRHNQQYLKFEDLTLEMNKKYPNSWDKLMSKEDNPAATLKRYNEAKNPFEARNILLNAINLYEQCLDK